MFRFHRLTHRIVRGRHVLLELAVAWCLAFMVWLYMHSRVHQTLEHTQIPLAVHLAPSQRDQFVLELPNISKATVSFSGPSARMRVATKPG